MDSQPWHLHRDLTEDRLRAIAELISNVRNSTIDTVEAAERVPWGTGCMIYDKTRDAITQRALECDWLSVVDSSMCFVFKIGEVPIRFYKGPPDEPTTRTLADHHPELNQLSIAFGEHDGHDLKWRFAIESDIDGKALSISFVGLKNTGEVGSRWNYSSNQRVVSIQDSVATKPQAKKLSAPQITIKTPLPDKKEDDEGKLPA